jgi:hypothetical protein
VVFVNKKKEKNSPFFLLKPAGGRGRGKNFVLSYKILSFSLNLITGRVWLHGILERKLLQVENLYRE